MGSEGETRWSGSEGETGFPPRGFSPAGANKKKQKKLILEEAQNRARCRRLVALLEYWAVSVILVKCFAEK